MKWTLRSETHSSPSGSAPCESMPEDRRFFRFSLLLILAVTLGLLLDHERRRPWPAFSLPAATPTTGSDVVNGIRVRHLFDLPYALTPAVVPEQQRLDLYYREALKEAPILVYIHGGGWDAGDKSGIGPKAGYYASRGVLVASVNYRLGPVSAQSNAATDLAAALSYLRFIAPRYGGDPDRIFIMGHSAGAHLAALVVCDERYFQPYVGVAESIRGVVLLDGSAYDVPEMMASPRGQGFVGAFGEDPRQWLKFSPATYASRRADLPPMLLVYAGEDLVRKVSAGRMIEALEARGNRHVLLSAPKLGHQEVDAIIGSDTDALTLWINGFLADPEGMTRRPSE